MELIRWSIYEVSSPDSLNGVMLRGRIRKLGIEGAFNVLAENTEDAPNGVRFAVTDSVDADKVTEYLEGILSEIAVKLVMKNVQNPVLSKLKVNIVDRYEL
jgi:hypothetical protein